MKIIDIVINTIRTKDPNHVNSFIPEKKITYNDIINEWDSDIENEISNSFKKLKQIGKLSDEIGIFNIYNIKNDPLERLLGIFNTKNETIFLDINCPQIKNILDLEDSVIYLTYITKL